jgi:glycosyltransferase involved in cell wall biosynthesis
MRVCHLVHHLALGGVETQLLRLIRASGDDVEYTVVSLDTDESLQSELEAAGARVVSLDLGGETLTSTFFPSSVRRLTGFLREESFDVLHCHTSLYLVVLGRLCGRLSGTPIVSTYHNPRESFHPTMQAAERVTRSLSPASIAVSKGVERTFADTAQMYQPGCRLDRRTYTIHNGIDVDEFRARVRDADVEGVRDEWGLGDGLVFLTVGRYSEEKNQLALVRAMADVVEEVPDAHLLVVGWGELEDDLRAEVRRLGLEGNATITGRVPSVHAYYGVADVFVLPSLTEGLSVVLLEAMAAGLPIVATDVSGTNEVVVEGETGLVVPPASVSALADAMLELLAEGCRREMGAKGYERVRDEFSVEYAVELYTDLYRRVD